VNDEFRPDAPDCTLTSARPKRILFCMTRFVLKVPAALFLIGFSVLFFATAPAYSQAGAAFRLIGTIEGSSGFTGAVLDDNSGTQTFYRIREPLPDGSRIVSIGSDRISIKRSDGSSYELFLVQSTKQGAAHPARAASSAASSAAASVPATDPVRRSQERAQASPVGPGEKPIPSLQNDGNDDRAPKRKNPRVRRSRRSPAAAQ
jgi:hypothetical protein